MARVFISWGNPDQDAVRQLTATLKATDIDCFEYSDEMRAGDQIHDRVLKEIHQAEIAVICLSNETVSRKWVTREITWSFADLIDDSRPMKALMPVRVGRLDKSSIPGLIQECMIYVSDLLVRPTDLQHGADRLIQDIRKVLGQPAPIVIPGTIIAMNSKQCEELFQITEKWHSLKPLCEMVGMGWGDIPPQELLNRYGDQAMDYVPFEDDKPFTHLVLDALNLLNEIRPKKFGPVFIRWYEPKFLLSGDREAECYVDHWRKEKRLIVIDSISMLIPEISQQLVNLLAVSEGGIDWQALLWIPPYTRHTVTIKDLISQTISDVFPLHTAFKDWTRIHNANISFDIWTEVGLMHWLSRALGNLAGERSALENNIKVVNQNIGNVGIKPRMHGKTT